MDDLICIGEITRIRGLKGEVKVFPLTDFPEQFGFYKKLIVRSGDYQRKLTVAGISFHGKALFMKFKEVKSSLDASELVGAEIVVKKSDRIPLSEDSFYFDDIQGFEVISVSGENIGILKDILHYPASDALVVDNGTSEFEIPFVRELVPEVNTDLKVIKIIDMPSLWRSDSEI